MIIFIIHIRCNRLYNKIIIINNIFICVIYSSPSIYKFFFSLCFFFQNSFFLSFKKNYLFIMTKDNSFQNLFNNIISKINLFLQKGIMVK